MKKLIILFVVTGLVAILSFKSPLTNPRPPAGYTGAPTQNRYCTNCHSDFALNTAGGSVFATGLPIGSYVPGQVYNFSITITHNTPMLVWGFEIKAVIAGTGTALGTFSTTNPNAIVLSSELKHDVAVSLTGTSYTFNNLNWTAPATGSSAVSFYMTGISGDNDGSEAGDYVYSNTILNIPIPVTMGDITGRFFDNSAIIEWSTYSESGSGHFDVERSIDGINFEVIKTIASSGNSNSIKLYSCTDIALPKNAPVLYYRLKMVDLNGKWEYSKLISVKQPVSTYLESIYPTLITSNESIQIRMVSSMAQPCVITILSATGQKLLELSQKLNKGQNEFSINSNGLKETGIFLLVIKGENFNETRKIIVQ
jgi:hypothetical protein